MPLQICEVHKRIDNDTTLRECTWCAFCKAWICEKDVSNYGRRARAAIDKASNAIGRSNTSPQGPRPCGCGKK